jgi:glutaredoxin-related protein
LENEAIKLFLKLRDKKKQLEEEKSSLIEMEAKLAKKQ